LSRDPIEENGGLNLYAMLANNPIGKTDYLGKGSGTDFAVCFITFYAIGSGMCAKYTGLLADKCLIGVAIAVAALCAGQTIIPDIIVPPDPDTDIYDPWPDSNEGCTPGSYRGHQANILCECTTSSGGKCYGKGTKETFFICKEFEVPDTIVIGPFEFDYGTKKIGRWFLAPAAQQGQPKCDDKGYTPCSG
jgi:hypothetical protein